MQRTSKHLSVFAIVACVVAVLAFGGTAAFAAGNWWNPPVGGNTLTVGITNDADFRDDIVQANVVVDVYKVADATADDSYETFSYTVVEPFNAGDNPLVLPEVANDTNHELWDEAAANAVAKIEGADPDKQAELRENDSVEVTGLADGMYLVVAHGDGMEPLRADSPRYSYTFKPILVAIPNKAAQDVDGETVINTQDSFGPWLSDVAINLKPERGPLYGSLRIEKKVDNFYGEPATFVFHIVSTDDSPFEYDNYASVYYTGGESAETTVTHIKAGTVVTVDEVYSGGRFEPVGDYQNINPGKAIVADSQVTDDNPIASVPFANHQTTDIGGHGIENNFTLEKTGDDPSNWDWSGWIAVPEDAAIDEPAAE